MTEETNTLQQELDKLEINHLQRVAQLWNIPQPGKSKRTVVKKLLLGMQDDFYIKGVLEKLSSTQVTIYNYLLGSDANVMTLGDISRKIPLPPMNTEMELGVLKRYYLVYQRKNRERLTNNLDRYHYYYESGDHVRTNLNDYSKKFKLSLSTILPGRSLTPEWRKVFKERVNSNGCFDTQTSILAAEPQNIGKALATLNATELTVIRECFYQGGLLEMGQVRELAQFHKKSWEPIVKKLHASGLLLDEYYVDNRFVRVMLLPQEIFDYLQTNPLPSAEKKGVRLRQSKRICNDLDFYLNVKKLISYISRRGINLAKSGKIKQVDLREIQEILLNTDTELFIEKSQVYQVELLLPVMRLLDIVRIKHEEVVLRNEYEKILGMDHFLLLGKIMAATLRERRRRSYYEDVFEALDVPFPRKELWQECVNYIQNHTRVMCVVAMAAIIRQRLLLVRNFRIQNFQSQLNELRRELTSVFFYLQLFGLIKVGYPERWIELSNLGHYYFAKKALPENDLPGGIILNPDMSLVVIPEKLSLRSLAILKTFTELKSYDNVYTFQITKQSFQNGMLLKQKPQELTDILKRTARKELSQNFLFLIKDWSQSFPLVQITDECVVVQTKEPKHMELLLGQIHGKRIVQEKISKNTILVYPEKISEVIAYTEKLDLLVKLIR